MPSRVRWQDLHELGKDVRTKRMSDIEADTAVTWAGRAVAAWGMYAETGNLFWRDDATEYASEAVEHAAQSGDDSVLRDVRRAIAEAREEALSKRPQRFVGR